MMKMLPLLAGIFLATCAPAPAFAAPKLVETATVYVCFDDRADYVATAGQPVAERWAQVADDLVWRLIQTPTRLDIVLALAAGPYCVTDSIALEDLETE